MNNFEQQPQNVDQDLAHALNSYQSISQLPSADESRPQSHRIELSQSHRLNLLPESVPLSTSVSRSHPDNPPQRVHKKFGAKKKSWVWNWYVQDETDNDIVICEECGKVIKRLASDKGSPKKLAEHLKTHRISKGTENTRRNNMATFNPHPPLLSNNAVRQPQELPTPALSDFDTSSYSQMKFHKDVMKFLTENKLPISIIRSPSFRQVVFSLRPEAIDDLNDLDHIYSSFIEVLKNNNRPESELPKYPDPATATNVSWL